jgi:hypothetical protein
MGRKDWQDWKIKWEKKKLTGLENKMGLKK